MIVRLEVNPSEIKDMVIGETKAVLTDQRNKYSFQKVNWFAYLGIISEGDG